ncbi:hypothetical protein KQX54_016980 [Cotesia glomerata]|uniref:Uncharacterized protein n=1 Tax=Cotesia glomerata TaxID=32391 RepID=A0AAV7HSM2_COTGL|nr:hypothetical protein KQX54_016980 [Cotesia glomerata]
MSRNGSTICGQELSTKCLILARVELESPPELENIVSSVSIRTKNRSEINVTLNSSEAHDHDAKRIERSSARIQIETPFIIQPARSFVLSPPPGVWDRSVRRQEATPSLFSILSPSTNIILLSTFLSLRRIPFSLSFLLAQPCKQFIVPPLILSTKPSLEAIPSNDAIRFHESTWIT